MKRARAILALLAFLAMPFSACSLRNREGPDVTCADLECGRVNACADGIIAQCSDGMTLRFHACESEKACEASWQKSGQYRCDSQATDCEGCRPDRQGCAAVQ